MIATIRVVSVEEAKTAIAMLEAYLAAHGEEEKPAPKTVTKAKTVEKAPAKKEPAPVKEEPAPVKEEPAPAKKVEKEAATSALSLAAITAKAKEVRALTSTAQIKEIIAKYTTGKLSTIKEEDYGMFMADLNDLVA
jgi:cell division septation protein DedD